MPKPFDLAKVQDISERLVAASMQPGYNMDVWESFKPEAREAVGDEPFGLEFMGAFLPAPDSIMPVRPSGTPECPLGKH